MSSVLKSQFVKQVILTVLVVLMLPDYELRILLFCFVVLSPRFPSLSALQSQVKICSPQDSQLCKDNYLLSSRCNKMPMESHCWLAYLDIFTLSGSGSGESCLLYPESAGRQTDSAVSSPSPASGRNPVPEWRAWEVGRTRWCCSFSLLLRVLEITTPSTCISAWQRSRNIRDLHEVQTWIIFSPLVLPFKRWLQCGLLFLPPRLKRSLEKMPVKVEYFSLNAHQNFLQCLLDPQLWHFCNSISISGEEFLRFFARQGASY